MADLLVAELASGHLAQAHACPIEDVVRSLKSREREGLSPDEVAERQARFGRNELREAPRTPAWKRFAAQFNALVIWMLIAAAMISGVLGEWADCLAILAIVLLNGMLGFFQESRAEQALAALQKLSAPAAKVLRGGRLQTVAASDLVPGDHVELEAGDNIPADLRLITAYGVRVQEAALTGESVPIDKVAGLVLAAATPLADRRNMAYLGTVVSAGKASAIVVATGMHTELGRIAGMLQHQDPEPTPLQRRLAELGKVLIVVCLAIVALISILQLLRGGDLVEVFLLSVSLAVAAVPEGLPAVVTVTLALGLQRMVRRNALVRKLPSVETLGSVSVICSDKTGTLTRNEMTVREACVGADRYSVTGVGYAPQGEFRRLNGELSSLTDMHRDLERLLEIGYYCNNASLVPSERADEWQIVGDPTEGALVVAAMKARIDRPDRQYRKVFEIPFDSERKAMSVVVADEAGQRTMFTKGAVESILPKCSREQANGGVGELSDARRAAILDLTAEMASGALRVLAFAYRSVPNGATEFQEADLVFCGLMGMIDPPREEAKQAVVRCHAAGIRPVMITGDHPATALAIAAELGIAEPTASAITGQELDQMSQPDLAAAVERFPVYARVSAEHKLRVVQAWKSRGQIVAMTGDGVNDAPAVKAADIGIAMGITGTDVTKEASDMVLTDDNFASIVNAVEEGRSIYDNIQKVLQFLLSCNAGEILLMLAASLLGWPAPLIPIQLLWINLVTDGLPALALSLEQPEPGIMRRPPRGSTDSMLSWSMGLRVLFQGALIGGVALAAFGIIFVLDPEQNVGRARTTAFCVLVYGELLRALAARSQRLTLWQLGLFTNPALLAAIALSALLQLSVVTLPFARPYFESAKHFMWEWWLIGLLAATPLAIIEAAKLLFGRLQGQTTVQETSRPATATT